MLPKAPVRPDPVRPYSVLHHHLIVDVLVPRRDESLVAREQPRVDPDLRDVERVRTSEEPQAVHEAPKRAKRAPKDVRAVAELRSGEVCRANEVTGLAHERGDADDLQECENTGSRSESGAGRLLRVSDLARGTRTRGSGEH